MKIKKRSIWIVILVLLALMGSFYIGGVMGFNEGTVAMEYLHGAQAYYTVTILERIRAGKDDSAIQLLEGKLDSQIYFLAYCDEYKTSIFYPASYKQIRTSEQSLPVLMKKVAAYRKKYPSPSQYKSAAKMIRESLRKYDQQ